MFGGAIHFSSDVWVTSVVTSDVLVCSSQGHKVGGGIFKATGYKRHVEGWVVLMMRDLEASKLQHS